MQINNYNPNFGSRFKININKNKPQEIVSLLELSMNRKINLKEASSNSAKDINKNGINYILNVENVFDESLTSYLEKNKIRFYKIV